MHAYNHTAPFQTLHCRHSDSSHHSHVHRLLGWHIPQDLPHTRLCLRKEWINKLKALLKVVYQGHLIRTDAVTEWEHTKPTQLITNLNVTATGCVKKKELHCTIATPHGTNVGTAKELTRPAWVKVQLLIDYVGTQHSAPILLRLPFLSSAFGSSYYTNY